MRFLTYLIPLLFIAGPAMADPVTIGVVIGGFVKKMFISFVVSAFVNQIFGGGARKKANAARPRSVMVNKNSSNDPIPVVYGRRRVGGTRVFVGTSNGSGGSGNNTLNMALVMAEGQMGDLKKLYFNDEVIFDGTLTHNSSITGSNDVDGNKYEGTYEIQYFDGRDDQTVSTVLQNSIGSSTWTNDHRLRGTAYLGIKLTFNADKYNGGVPLITAEMDGKKITSTADYTSTVDGADQNPVDVLYDYLTNTRYGKGLDGSATGKIDRATFTSVRSDIGSFYKINGNLDSDIRLYENIQEILDASNLMLIYTNGKYTLKARKQNESATYAFTQDDILDGMQVQMPDKQSKKNKITVTFPDQSSDYNYNENIKIVESSSFLTADNNAVLEGRVEFNLITDATLATSLATYKMNASRKTMVVQFEAPHVRLPVECGDIISITNSDFGFSSKLFRVLQMELTSNNTINIIAQEYDSSIELT
jgi:hypothetical protein